MLTNSNNLNRFILSELGRCAAIFFFKDLVYVCSIYKTNYMTDIFNAFICGQQ